MSESARAVIATIAEQWAVPGGAVVAVDRRGEVFSHRFGHADVAAGIPVAPHHLFEIGSISKVFTSIVVLRLARKGLIRLDDSVGAVLDWLPEPLRADGITIERLLNHTAGLVASVDALPDDMGQATAFAGHVSSALPGTFFHYSNLGFILLGLAARRVSGRPLVDLVREEILDPLRMTSAVACVTHDDYSSLARGYQPLRDDRPWAPGDPLIQAPWLEVAGADGNIAATASELARFARMLLGKGTLDGTSILDAADFDTMVGTTAPEGEDVLALPGVPPTETSRYGLGINVETTDGRTVLSHGGGMVGYASFLLADLDDGTAVCVVTNANGDTPVAEAIARSVAAELRSPGTVDLDGVNPHWWNARYVEEMGYTGEFVDTEPESGPRRIEVFIEERDGDRARIAVHCNGDRAPLLRTWTRGAVARMRSLERFTLVFGDDAWQWGPRTFARAGASPATARSTSTLQPFCGHFRSYTPWFTNFRVVLRRDRLVLIASGGVEAPAEEAELVAEFVGQGGSTFRIGADPRLPERITFGPPVDGLAPWGDRDGCRYSRAFTD
jgi:CubicO group peptidase (beta-lactamase class C family)